MAERIFGGKGSYDKYSLVKEFKQQYLLELEVIFLPSPPSQLFQNLRLFGTLEYECTDKKSTFFKHIHETKAYSRQGMRGYE